MSSGPPAAAEVPCCADKFGSVPAVLTSTAVAGNPSSPAIGEIESGGIVEIKNTERRHQL